MSEPDTLFIVMYAELLNFTSKSLDQLVSSREEHQTGLGETAIRVHEESAKSWLERFKELSLSALFLCRDSG